MFDVSRKELKYIVSPHEISGLKRRLSPLMRSDPHNGGQGEEYVLGRRLQGAFSVFRYPF